MAHPLWPTKKQRVERRKNVDKNLSIYDKRDLLG